MTKKMYLWISTIFTIIIVFLVGTLYYFSLDINKTIYPTYTYENYIDRSESKIFNHNGGMQLYEAETMTFDDGSDEIYKINASKKYVLAINEDESILTITISSNIDCKVSLTMCVNYLGEVDTLANVLCEIKVNNKVLTKQSRIFACQNDLQFLENNIGEIELNKGPNEITFTSKLKDWMIDYFTLNPSIKRNTKEETIGIDYFKYNPFTSRQLLETEFFRYDENTLTIYDKNYSLFYYTQTLMGHSIVLNIYSPSDYETFISINAWGNKQCVVEISVNEKSIKHISLFSNKNEIEIGKISLKKGTNTIVLNAFNGDLFIDNLVFNSDINYSVDHHTRKFEAERATLKGNCKIEQNENVSGGYNVGYCFENSSISFDINSNYQIKPHLSLAMSYVGSKDYLSEIMKIEVNDKIIDLTSCKDFFSGDYAAYKYVYIGDITINNGNNLIKITSISGDYNLDFITLSTWNTEDVIFEAENADLTSEIIIESNENASSGQNVGYLVKNSSCEFNMLSNGDNTYELFLGLSFGINGLINLDDCLEIKINNQISICNVDVDSDGVWTNFLSIKVGTIELKEGINAIQLTCKSEIFNIDYMELKAVD